MVIRAAASLDKYMESLLRRSALAQWDTVWMYWCFRTMKSRCHRGQVPGTVIYLGEPRRKVCCMKLRTLTEAVRMLSMADPRYHGLSTYCRDSCGVSISPLSAFTPAAGAVRSA